MNIARSVLSASCCVLCVMALVACGDDPKPDPSQGAGDGGAPASKATGPGPAPTAQKQPGGGW